LIVLLGKIQALDSSGGCVKEWALEYPDEQNCSDADAQK